VVAIVGALVGVCVEVFLFVCVGEAEVDEVLLATVGAKEGEEVVVGEKEGADEEGAKDG